MKGSPAIGTRLLNGLELKHQSRFGLDCLNDHSIAEDLSRLLVERTSRGVEAFNCTPRGMLSALCGYGVRGAFNCTPRGMLSALCGYGVRGAEDCDCARMRSEER